MEIGSLAPYILFLGGYIWLVAWAVGDAQKRGDNGCLPIILLFCLGPFGALFWLMLRPGPSLSRHSPIDYSNPDDALVAASRLDSLGDWDAAIAVYRNVAVHWPEHATYVENCVADIRHKQAPTCPDDEGASDR